MTTDGNEDLDTRTMRAITSEVLRHRIKELIDDPNSAPRWQRVVKGLLGSPLFSLIVSLLLGFYLTGVVGSRLADRYHAKQAELERQLSFTNELNKIRVNKIAEIWEKVYPYEAEVRRIMETITITSASALPQVIIPAGKNPKLSIEHGKLLEEELMTVLEKNRFWLRDEEYDSIKKYAESLYEYYIAVQTQQDITDLETRRTQAEANRARILETILKR